MIKKFGQLNEKVSPLLANKILTKLKNGFAIKVDREYIDDFFDVIETYEYQKDIDFSYDVDEYINQKMKKDHCDIIYIVLIGKKLYYTTKPNFWGQEFEIYIPSIDRKYHKDFGRDTSTFD